MSLLFDPSEALLRFMATHFAHFNEWPPFENEYKTLLNMVREPFISEKMILWISQYEVDMSHKSVSNSEGHREDGNRLIRANKKLNALKASLCYTKAIFSAPDGSKALSLAHANRSVAIAEFGYYKEAYEDCQCAIDYGYPEENLQKIIIRQAFCASKMDDQDKLLACLEKLRAMTLSPPFAKQKAGFEDELLRLQQRRDLNQKPKPQDNVLEQKILTDPQKGRYMVASKNIAKGECVLIERAFSFVPVNEYKICSACSKQNIIPFPCNVCCQAFYCSLKCRQSQVMVHKFECYANRSGLMQSVGITHLALNTLLNGLPSIVPQLKDCKSIETIWGKIEEIAQTEDKGYAEILALVTNLKLMQPEDIRTYALSSLLMSFYLAHRTAFFNLFEGCACGSFEWTIIVSALLLRHTAQMTTNAHTGVSLVCRDDSQGFYALSDVWGSPQHLKKGRLHTYAEIGLIYSGIFSTLSICNHSCAPSFVSRFDGDRVIALARHQLKQSSEIHNAYLGNYKSCPRAERQQELKENYFFECKCELCSSAKGDDELLKRHRYRCSNSTCEAVFTLPTNKLQWWALPILLRYLACPVCRTQLCIEWFLNFEIMCEDMTKIADVLNIFHFSSRILVGLNDLRLKMSNTVLQLFFEAWTNGISLSRSEFDLMAEALKYSMSVLEQWEGVESLNYAVRVTYALDLMAQGKYPTSFFDCQKIRRSFCMLSEELKVVFENYVKDYLGETF